MEHEPFCEGWHTADITCRDATDFRDRERANPWWCYYSHTGYHGFVAENPEPDEQCRYVGCDRTYGELQATLTKPSGKPRLT
jgi:hypothetical protein